jgi:2-hydroxychromene-2-carboxylate isomerase
MRSITVYTDYKSPYAYLANDLAYELERDLPVRLEWLPYLLDIPSFLGSASRRCRWQHSGREPQRASVASRALQLHGLSSPGAQTRAGHSRASEA